MNQPGATHLPTELAVDAECCQRSPRLTAGILPLLPIGVERPQYEREHCSVGIVHIGVGGFHRSHQAAYLDRLLDDPHTDTSDWGICGLGVLDTDYAMQAALRSQDCLYTLVLKHGDGRKQARVVGSMLRYVHAPTDPDAALDVLSQASTRIVSLTITEGGYFVDPATGRFDASDPKVIADLEAYPKCTAFGWIIQALKQRRSAGLAPFTVMSCDNVRGNGHVTRRTVLGFARMVDPDLAEWIEATVAFPNTMVDRITPATRNADRQDVLAEWGYDDACPVVAEPFCQWVIEDHFPGGRPDWARAGVQLVADVEPYELMKLYLLNGVHQLIAQAGKLVGAKLIHEALAVPWIATFADRYLHEEAIPAVPPIAGVDLPAYASTVLARFANPSIADTLDRVGGFGSDKLAGFVLPVLRANLAARKPIDLGTRIVACWAYWLEHAPSGSSLPDNRAAQIQRLVDNQHNDSLALLDLDIFDDVRHYSDFRASFGASLEMLRANGGLPE